MWRALATVAARPAGAATTTATATATAALAASAAATTPAATPAATPGAALRSPLAAAAAVARVLMLAHGSRTALPFACFQYPQRLSAAPTASVAPRRAFASASAAGAPDQTPAKRDHHQPPLPAAHSNNNNDTYDIRITLRAYDLRFLEEAACAVQDLVLINLAPKDALSLLGTASDGAARAALRDGHGVAFSCLGAATPPKQRTLYSLIRSPHKYKTSFEQFERVAHRRVVSASTPDHDEAQWLLACLRFYQFTGVEVEVSVTSAPTYLLPAPAAAAAAAAGGAGGGGGGGGVFAAHRARFPALFEDAAAAAAAASAAPSLAAGEADGAEQERQREALAAGLRGLREALSGGGGGSNGGAKRGDAASLPASSSSSSPPQHPLLAAVDRVLGGLDVDALVREELERRRAGAHQQQEEGGEPPASLLGIPPELLLPPPAAEAAPAAAADNGAAGQSAAAPAARSRTAADWLYATMAAGQNKGKGAAASPSPVVDEREALAAAREQYARFAAALQVALLRGWAARV